MPKTYNKFVIGNTTYLDLSSDTVTAETLMQGYTAHDKNGNAIIGTASGSSVTIVDTQDSAGGIIREITAGTVQNLKTVYTGSNAPTSSIGVDGDVYIQE